MAKRRVRALTVDGELTWCTAEVVGTKGCNHIGHYKNEQERLAAQEKFARGELKATGLPELASQHNLETLSIDKEIARVQQLSDSERIALARDAHTVPEILEALAKDDDYLVTSYVADNSNTPGEALELLARDESADIRMSVAANPNTPVKTLQELSKDQTLAVQEGLASNPNTPAEVLLTLSKHENNFVKVAVLQNPSSPVAALNLLTRDENRKVREEAIKRVQNPFSLPASYTPSSNLRKVNENDYESLPYWWDNDSIHRTYDGNGQWSVNNNLDDEYDAAVSSSTSPDTLRELSESTHSEVRVAVVGNPRLPREALEDLTYDEYEEVRGAALAIISTSDPSTPVESLKERAKPWNSAAMRKAVAENMSTPLEVLRELARDDDMEVRKAVAQNPNTPAEVLFDLQMSE